MIIVKIIKIEKNIFLVCQVFSIIAIVFYIFSQLLFQDIKKYSVIIWMSYKLYLFIL